jgi:hypothetical protein
VFVLGLAISAKAIGVAGSFVTPSATAVGMPEFRLSAEPLPRGVNVSDSSLFIVC